MLPARPPARRWVRDNQPLQCMRLASRGTSCDALSPSLALTAHRVRWQGSVGTRHDKLLSDTPDSTPQAPTPGKIGRASAHANATHA